MFKILIDQIPEFDGGENGVPLERFQKHYKFAAESVADSPVQKGLLEKIVFTKLKGRALKMITNRVIYEADDLFEFLKNTYESEKSFEHLVWDLYMVNNKDASAKSLFNVMAPIRDSICSDITKSATKREVIEALANAFEKIAISAYLRKLPSEIGNVLSNRTFDTLENIFKAAKEQEKVRRMREIDSYRYNKHNKYDHVSTHNQKVRFKNKIEKRDSSIDVKPSTSNPSNDKKTLVCKHCGKLGHTKERCFKLTRPIKTVENVNPSDDESSIEDETEERSNLNTFADSQSDGTESD